ncbi:short-chain dehydrogenase/ reductase [Dactylonectria macrodidyma]|uniref:Short-chain dehydrogenase/ reductase n=1 Tax=Dactylonectria macrodidyma TaxID=307937 RepID=A0A9P9E259_9HYPO|nr:short-chain dehydrogenase/ reductase [Dactylonectria macrodidyma]
MAPLIDNNTAGSLLIEKFAENIRNKVILITGTSTGSIGALFCVAISKARPSLVILAGRNAVSLQKTEDEIKAIDQNVQTRPLIIDVASFQSVRAAAAQVNSWVDVPHIDLLVNNAEIMGVPYSKTEDGFEKHFATNYRGHFLLTNLVMDKILASQAHRVVIDGKHYDMWRAYGHSKTASSLMAVSLAQKLRKKRLQAFSPSPGVYNDSNMMRGIDIGIAEILETLSAADVIIGTSMMHPEQQYNYKSADQIIARHIFCSFCDDIKGHNGGYFDQCRIADQYKEEVYPWAIDRIEADRLWTLSEKLVGHEFKY